MTCLFLEPHMAIVRDTKRTARAEGCPISSGKPAEKTGVDVRRDQHKASNRTNAMLSEV